MKKKILAAVVGSVLAAGAAQAVTYSTTGVGDLLIAPSYMIGGGWKSQLKVVNTNLRRSIVAKVVVHDNILSAELLDFLIYLSPGDVFVGDLKALVSDPVTGVVTQSLVESFDDSVTQLNSSKWATATEPLRIEGTPAARLLSTWGYITVTGVASYDRYDNGLGTVIALNAPGVSKADIKSAHDALFSVFSVSPLQTVPAANGVGNDLAGFVTISNELSGQYASLPTVALADYNNITPQLVGADSSIGAPNSTTTLAEIDAVLPKGNLVVPFETGNKQTWVSVTYPTKLTYRRNNLGGYVFPLWNGLTNYGKVPFTTTIFDFMENMIVATVSPLDQNSTFEHDWKVFGTGAGKIPVGTFTAGWAEININRAPVISTYLTTDGKQIAWSYTPVH